MAFEALLPVLPPGRRGRRPIGVKMQTTVPLSIARAVEAEAVARGIRPADVWREIAEDGVRAGRPHLLSGAPDGRDAR